MRVDHRRFDVGVTQVVVDLPYVHAIEKQVRCETVSQCMNRDWLMDLQIYSPATGAWLALGVSVRFGSW